MIRLLGISVRQSRVASALFSAALLFLVAAKAGAEEPPVYYPILESDWTPFFRSSSARYYYSPSSIQRMGRIVRVKYYGDMPVEGALAVWTNEIDCVSRTINSVSADMFDWRTKAFISSTDLRGGSAKTITRDTMPYDLAQRVC
jgi:hypothetical protein